MENTYQDLITDIQSKNPKISGKLEGGKKFKIKSDFKPAGDQPEAIKKLVNGANKEEFNQVLLGVTGSGKTFTMAKVIEATNRPALILAPNKTLAAQLYGEMKTFFPDNAVEYFVSYYDYYTPEAYVPWNISLRCVIIIIRYEIFNCIIWEESFHLSIKLCSKSFVRS